MLVHVVDINLPKQRSNVPLEGNWHFLSSCPMCRTALLRWSNEMQRRRKQTQVHLRFLQSFDQYRAKPWQ
jgi:hypothetical protein